LVFVFVLLVNDVHAQLDKIVYAVLLTRIDWWTELSTPMVISACSRKWFRFFGGWILSICESAV